MRWKKSSEMRSLLEMLLEGKEPPEKVHEEIRNIKLSGNQKIRIIDSEIQERKARLTQMEKEIQNLIASDKEIPPELKLTYKRLEDSIRILETEKMLAEKEIDEEVEKRVVGKPISEAVEVQSEEISRTAEELRSIKETRREIEYETRDITSEFDRKFGQSLKQGAKDETKEEREREKMYTT
jgi:hypothetical protein